MSKNKKIFLRCTVIIASLVAVWYMYLDFSKLLGFRDSTYPAYLIKRIDVVCAVLVVLATGKDALLKKDSFLLKLSFIAICLAEVFFVLSNTFGGIGFFLVCQILLSIRNSQGMKNKLSSLKDSSTKKKLIFCGIGISVLYVMILCFVFYPILKISTFLFIFFVYGLFLSVSFFIGVASHILELFPRKNTLLISIGIAAFYFSDILVGLLIVLKEGLLNDLAGSFIWVLYAPAIFMLAFSGYKLDHTKD